MVESSKQVPSQIERPPFFLVIYLAVWGLRCGTRDPSRRIFVGSCRILHHSPLTLWLWCVDLVNTWLVVS